MKSIVPAITVALGLLVTRVSAIDRHVWQGGSPDGVYGTWETAATNIQDAINAAADSETVWVTNGDYAVTSTLVITNGIVLQSADSNPAKTVITRAGTNLFRVMLVSNAAAVVSGFTVTNGSISASGESGAGMYVAAGMVSNCAILRNTVAGDTGGGGGAYLATNTLLVDTVVWSNRVVGSKTYYGCGLRVSGGTVRRCRIGENYHVGQRITHGGGVHMTGGRLENSVIVSNRASDTAGGVYLVNSIVRGCLIYENIACDPTNRAYGLGGGVYAGAGSSNVVESCTIVANAARNGGGVYSTSTNDCAISNSIVYFNRTFSGEGNPNYDGVRFAWSCTTTGNVAGRYVASAFGDGNCFDDPGFADVASGDFRLRRGSPAIDRGYGQSWMTGARDLAGNERLLPAGGTNDMGAYEYQTGPLCAYFSADVTSALDATTAICTATVDGTNLAEVGYAWDFDNNGAVDADGPGAAHLFPAGLYSVRLTVTNGAGETSTFLRRNYIRVAPLTPICVATNGSATPPYDTWSRALTNLADAVALAAAGATGIVVSGGAYAIPGMLTLGAPVTLLAADGPSNTVIQSPGCGRAFYMAHDAAVLDGFTITNSAGPLFEISGGDGGCLYLAAGLVRNCVIANNNGPNRRYGGGVFMSGGMLSNCQVYANTGGGSGLGGGVAMTSGVVAHCSIYGNTLLGNGKQGAGVYASGGRIVNSKIIGNTINGSISQGGGLYLAGTAEAVGCLVYTNTAQSTAGGGQGGGIYGGRAVNCTVVDNYARVAGSGTYNTTLTNSIVYYNTPGISNAWFGSNVAYSCVPSTNGLTGPGNIESDPRFENRGGGNYRLRAGSPCFNAGATADWMNTMVDLDGNPRVKGGNVDMGAYESIRLGSTIISLR